MLGKHGCIVTCTPASNAGVYLAWIKESIQGSYEMLPLPYVQAEWAAQSLSDPLPRGCYWWDFTNDVDAMAFFLRWGGTQI